MGVPGGCTGDWYIQGFTRAGCARGRGVVIGKMRETGENIIFS